MCIHEQANVKHDTKVRISDARKAALVHAMVKKFDIPCSEQLLSMSACTIFTTTGCGTKVCMCVRVCVCVCVCMYVCY
jgi:hypothetical protein